MSNCKQLLSHCRLPGQTQSSPVCLQVPRTDAAGMVSAAAARLCALSPLGCVLPRLSPATISCLYEASQSSLRLLHWFLHCGAGFSGPSINPRIQLTQQCKRISCVFIRCDYKRWFFIYLRLRRINTCINAAGANGIPPGRAAAGAPRSAQPRRARSRQVALQGLVRAGPAAGLLRAWRCAAAAVVDLPGGDASYIKSLFMHTNCFIFHAPSFSADSSKPLSLPLSLTTRQNLITASPLLFFQHQPWSNTIHFHPIITFSLRANPARSTITEDSKNNLICTAWPPSGCRIQWIHTRWPHPSQRPLPRCSPVYIARKCKERKVHAWDNIKIHGHRSISPSRSIAATSEPLKSLPWRCAHRPWWSSFKPLLNASAAPEETVFILPCQF